jgi:hypothetical protein
MTGLKKELHKVVVVVENIISRIKEVVGDR